MNVVIRFRDGRRVPGELVDGPRLRKHRDWGRQESLFGPPAPIHEYIMQVKVRYSIAHGRVQTKWLGMSRIVKNNDGTFLVPT